MTPASVFLSQRDFIAFPNSLPGHRVMLDSLPMHFKCPSHGVSPELPNTASPCATVAGGNPSIRQMTIASRKSQPAEHTPFQTPPIPNSTRPSLAEPDKLSTNRNSTAMRRRGIKKKMNVISGFSKRCKGMFNEVRATIFAAIKLGRISNILKLVNFAMPGRLLLTFRACMENVFVGDLKMI